MPILRTLACLFGIAGISCASWAAGQVESKSTGDIESYVGQFLLPVGLDTSIIQIAESGPSLRFAAPANTSQKSSLSKKRSQTGEPKPATTSAKSTKSPRTPAAGSKPTSRANGRLVDPLQSTDDEPLVEPVAETSDLVTVEVEPEKPLSSELVALRARVRRVLALYFRKHLNTRDNDPWEMMHGIIAYGVDAKIRRGGPDGNPVNAIAYLSTNGRMAGVELLNLDRGRINARKGQKVQGHYGQLLAILAQSRVMTDYPLQVGGQSFNIADLIESEQRTCRSGIELTFKLMSFAHYLDSDETWQNEAGETWDIPKLISEELKQPILSNAACGGTHRLMGFAYAVHNRKKQNRPLDGQWLRAEKYLDDYHNYTFALQNSDGSFSTEWFRRREAKDDINRRIQTTGHILEWMAYSLPQRQLDDPRMIKAVRYLTGIMLAEPNREWEVGPVGHAIHALSIYDQRRFRPLDETGVGVARRKPMAPAVEPDDDEIDESGPRLNFQR